MAAFIAKFVGKKILAERLENQFGTEDPYFEQVPASRLDGKPSGKVKRRRKALPPGISEHDGRVLTKVKRRAYRLDMCLFSFMGIKFGWGSVIGIVPAIGDVLDALLALMVFKTCNQVEGGLPSAIKLKMFLNIAFDFVIGIIPFVGDIVDAAFRANTRNAIILEDYLREQGKKNLKKRGEVVPDIDPSSPEEYDRRQREREAGLDSEPSAVQDPMPTAPQTAQVRSDRRWFGRQASQQDDLETGHARQDGRTERTSSRRESRRERR
ncbi:hypothetical protein B0I35DRAFT_479990 [Stachybotrys elegans]|uniref:PH domain-containing protein n=1 Tax=Stachybotrys elegans TaxID=80388 RepID=A0A8K0WNS4_9HYPO|nr:hypothetical protein B0I35DRAFT_479990 [Stachybotrys elegans]